MKKRKKKTILITKSNLETFKKHVFNLLLQKSYEIKELHDIFNININEVTMNFLKNHPSIHFEENRVEFIPFCNCINKEMLVQFINDNFPTVFKKTDFIGIYPFVIYEIEEMIFHKQFIELENDIIIPNPLAIHKNLKLSDEFKNKWSGKKK